MKSDFEKLSDYRWGLADEATRQDVEAELARPGSAMRVLLDRMDAATRRWFQLPTVLAADPSESPDTGQPNHTSVTHDAPDARQSPLHRVDDAPLPSEEGMPQPQELVQLSRADTLSKERGATPQEPQPTRVGHTELESNPNEGRDAADRRWHEYLDWLLGMARGLVDVVSGEPTAQARLATILDRYRLSVRAGRRQVDRTSGSLWFCLVKIARARHGSVSLQIGRSAPLDVVGTETVREEQGETLTESLPENSAFTRVFVDECMRCVQQMDSWYQTPLLMRIAELSLESYGVREISVMVARPVEYVETALRIIKEQWNRGGMEAEVTPPRI